jgi:hypothetical protein
MAFVQCTTRSLPYGFPTHKNIADYENVNGV